MISLKSLQLFWNHIVAGHSWRHQNWKSFFSSCQFQNVNHRKPWGSGSTSCSNRNAEKIHWVFRVGCPLFQCQPKLNASEAVEDRAKWERSSTIEFYSWLSVFFAFERATQHFTKNENLFMFFRHALFLPHPSCLSFPLGFPFVLDNYTSNTRRHECCLPERLMHGWDDRLFRSSESGINVLRAAVVWLRRKKLITRNRR